MKATLYYCPHRVLHWARIATASMLLLWPHPARTQTQESSYRQELPSRAALQKGSATKNANLSPAACRRRLQKHPEFVRERRNIKGIANPVRISAQLEGVSIEGPSKRSIHGLLDCRLALALKELVPLLKRHKVAAMKVENFYRKNARVARRRVRSQHAYGLAADVVSFRLTDGTVLDVEEDYRGKVGLTSCGPDAAPSLATRKARLLRDLVCALGRSGAFHHVLTPNYNAAHRSHLHLDIKRGNRWFSLR